MKIQIFSDIHLEFGDYMPDVSQADVVVLSGDIWVGKKGISWVLDNIKSTPTIYVLGNHEYWRHAHPKLIQDLRKETAGTNIHVLENDLVSIYGVNFFGATLWTNYDLYGDRQAATLVCWQLMNDYKRIRISPTFRKFRPSDTVRLHHETLRWLDNELAAHSNEKNVVVTHHAPCQQSLHSEYEGDILNAAYASDLTHFIKKHEPLVWTHGHVHKSNDYKVGVTRVVSNAMGNPYSRNSDFLDRFIIEV